MELVEYNLSTKERGVYVGLIDSVIEYSMRAIYAYLAGDNLMANANEGGACGIAFAARQIALNYNVMKREANHVQ